MKFILAVILFSHLALASNFDGVWKGVGVMNSSNEGVLQVDPIVFEFSSQGQMISSKDCWSFKFSANDWRYCGHRTLEIKGSDIYYTGVRIGTFSENKISVSYIEGAAQVDAVAEIKDNGTLNYHYQSINPSGKFLIQDATGLTR